MPVNTQHELYKKSINKVEKTRDCFNGSEAVKDEGEKYLPMLSGQTVNEYDSFKMRALFLSVVEPTATAFVGAIMRKPPVIKSKATVDDVNGKGRGLSLLSAMSVNELLLAGRVGILVDYINERPVMLLYRHESIINWNDDSIILEQSYNEPVENDEFEVETKKEYVQLKLVDGLYQQIIWRSKGDKFEVYRVIEPTIRGTRLDFIPFSSCNTAELSLAPKNPLLLSIAEINLDHYRLAADLKQGLHFIALPTMFGFGDFKDGDGMPIQIRVGSTYANIVPDDEARVELLEYKGDGVGSISDDMARDVDSMAALGAKMLQSRQGGVESAETARISASSGSATMSTVANAVDALIVQSLTWYNLWSGFGESVEFSLNKDFIDIKLDPTTLMALLKTWQSGGMSLDSFLYNLEKGDLFPDGISREDELDRIETTGIDFSNES